MPEMNENVPSGGADQGLERNGAAKEAAALLRTAASALLSAAEIWTTSDVARPSAPAAVAADTPVVAPADATAQPDPAFPHKLRPSEVLAEAKFFSLQGKRQDQGAPVPPPLPSDIPIDVEIARALEKHAAAALAKVRDNAPQPQQRGPAPQTWPPQKLSLALQGGGSFGAFTWGVLERLLEESACEISAISGASVGAINATLLACGLVQGGREGARKLLARFWQRMTNETSFRSLMLIGGFSTAGSAVAFGPTLRSGQFDPFDLDPLREALARDIDFAALRSPSCPQLLVAATRVRDGRQQIFDNAAMSADVLLASTCPPLVHCAVEIEGEHYWDGGYGANPPLVRLLEEAASPDLLVVQVTPARDSFVPITAAAIDRRLDQITANAALHAELSALEWARERGLTPAKIHRIAAEDEIDGLAQRNPGDLGRGFVALLHGRGRAAADRWLRVAAPAKPIPFVTAEDVALEDPALIDA
jgi:NTE family protein